MSKLTVSYPDRADVNFYHDATIFNELATRYELLGNDETTLAMSKSIICTFIRMDELAYSQGSTKHMKLLKVSLESEYEVMASYLDRQPSKDFCHAPALETCLLAHLHTTQTLLKHSPKMPPLINSLFQSLLQKYHAVIANQSAWWEDLNDITMGE